MPILFAILGNKKIYKHNKGIFKFLKKKWLGLVRLGENVGIRNIKRGEG